MYWKLHNGVSGSMLHRKCRSPFWFCFSYCLVTHARRSKICYEFDVNRTVSEKQQYQYFNFFSSWIWPKCNSHFLNNVITCVIKTKVLLPLSSVTLAIYPDQAIWLSCSQNLKLFGFERHLMKDISETRRAHYISYLRSYP